MSNGRIFCLGRPIIDIVGFVPQKYLEELVLSKKICNQNPVNLESFLERMKEEDAAFSVSIGGVENNVAVNAALLGMPSVLVGSIGNDDFGLVFRSKWKTIKEIDTTLISVRKQKTAMVAVFSLKDKQKEVKIIHYGSSEFLPWNNSVRQALEESRLFFSSLFSANTAPTREVWSKAIRLAYARKKKVVISLAGISTVQNDLEELIVAIGRYANVVFLNEAEHNFLLRHIGNEIISVFPDIELIVITRDKHGSSIWRSGKKDSGWLQISPPRVLGETEGIFKIGAGDAFCAGFLLALSRGKKEEESAHFASEISLTKLQYPSSSLILVSSGELERLKQELRDERRKKWLG